MLEVSRRGHCRGINHHLKNDLLVVVTEDGDLAELGLVHAVGGNDDNVVVHEGTGIVVPVGTKAGVDDGEVALAVVGLVRLPGPKVEAELAAAPEGRKHQLGEEKEYHGEHLEGGEAANHQAVLHTPLNVRHGDPPEALLVAVRVVHIGEAGHGEVALKPRSGIVGGGVHARRDSDEASQPQGSEVVHRKGGK